MVSYGCSIGTQTCRQVGNRYYKLDTRGYESIAEVVADELLNCIKGLEHVPYYLDRVKVNGVIKDACYSESMISNSETLISIYDLLDDEDGYFWYSYGEKSPDERVRMIVEGILKFTGISSLSMLSNIVKFDYIIRNEDRHFNNISVIKSKEGYRFSPVYDNGLSMLSNIVNYPMENRRFTEMVSSTRARPFSTSFEEQVELFSGQPKLQIDIRRFFHRMKEAVDCIDYSVPFKQEGFKRCLKVLDYTLSKSVGRVWEEWES